MKMDPLDFKPCSGLHVLSSGGPNSQNPCMVTKPFVEWPFLFAAFSLKLQVRTSTIGSYYLLEHMTFFLSPSVVISSVQQLRTISLNMVAGYLLDVVSERGFCVSRLGQQHDAPMDPYDSGCIL